MKGENHEMQDQGQGNNVNGMSLCLLTAASSDVDEYVAAVEL
jgi:hypothetical protein